MRRSWGVLLVALLCFAPMFGPPAWAQDRRQNEPGKFDYYVLALSWSPSFCEQAGERKSAQQQCGARPFSFVVHGLWPQYERGFPEFCQQPAPFIDSPIINGMLDLMPARPLVIHEWRKHGVCAGLPARGLFRDHPQGARGREDPRGVSRAEDRADGVAGEVEEAFVKANPGLSRAGVSVTCSSTHLNEVRICLTRDLKFRDCQEGERRACRREKLVMPPVRGG